MRYYRFSRRRKNYQFDYNRSRRISTKKQNHMVNNGRSKLLESFYFENQAWGALHKVWKGYIIAKNKGEYDKMELYARRIQELQRDLGLGITSFPNIGMTDTNFLWELAQKKNNDNNHSNENNQLRTVEENYRGDSQYEEERFTDTYSEYFQDDENKGDRFTDDYHENFTD